MDGASATQSLPAPELGPGHADDIPQIPEQRRFGISGESLSLSVEREIRHGCPLGTSVFLNGLSARPSAIALV
jgi:hypothetical protein